MAISIKPKNKGKFTAKAHKAGKSVQAYATQVLKPGSKASVTTKKQANFVKNAAKWRKSK